MPYELVAVLPKRPELRSYMEPAIEPHQVRLQSIFSTVKHGTQLRSYRGDTLDVSEPFDWDLKLHLRDQDTKKAAKLKSFPMALGTATVGEVIMTGSEVDIFRIGDIVYSNHLSIRETHTVSVKSLKAVPAGMDPQAVVCWDPVSVALSGVRDSQLGVGDKVLVTGLGAIGQMALQLARLQGATWVAGADPIARRRDLALRHGADLVIDPTKDDVGLLVKTITNKMGADAVIESSGSYAGLGDALRAAAYGATVVSVAYYTGSGHALSLEGEWHRNRINLLSSRDNSTPHRLSPRWDVKRLEEVAFQLLEQRQIEISGLLNPVVSFKDSAEAYRQIDENPASSIKLGVTFP